MSPIFLEAMHYALDKPAGVWRRARFEGARRVVDGEAGHDAPKWEKNNEPTPRSRHIEYSQNGHSGEQFSQLAAALKTVVMQVPVYDIHTHLYDPAFGDLLTLWHRRFAGLPLSGFRVVSLCRNSL
jgi:hypothetical protein